MSERERSEESAVDMDPVCGVELIVKPSTVFVSYAGQRLHFCSDECRVKFLHEPDRYTASWIETM